MKKVSLFIALLATITMHAQIDTLTHSRYVKEMKLPTLQNSIDTLAFRVIFDKSLLTIRTADLKSYTGTITFFLTPVKYKNNLPEYGKLKFKTFDLHPDTARYIGERFLKDSILYIPNADDLKWNTGLDGYTYHFESYFENKFQSKSYWCPGKGYGVDPYEKTIYLFGSKVLNTIKNTGFELEFINSLPTGTYTDGWAYRYIRHTKSKKKNR